jgi:hypothetical protein
VAVIGRRNLAKIPRFLNRIKEERPAPATYSDPGTTGSQIVELRRVTIFRLIALKQFRDRLNFAREEEKTWILKVMKYVCY